MCFVFHILLFSHLFLISCFFTCVFTSFVCHINFHISCFTSLVSRFLFFTSILQSVFTACFSRLVFHLSCFHINFLISCFSPGPPVIPALNEEKRPVLLFFVIVMEGWFRCCSWAENDFNLIFDSFSAKQKIGFARCPAKIIFP
jgi:hypothetical protein